MAEVVGAFLGAELWHERANCSVELGNCSRGNLAQQSVEFAVRQLDWIEVGRVFRQVAKCRSRFLDRLANTRNQVDTAVVHHDDVVAPECGNQALLDIGEEHLSGHGALNHHWRGHLVVAQGAHEGDCLPFSKRNGADHPGAPSSPPSQSHHVGANRSLVDKHQPGGIKHALLSYPASARAGHLRSLSFRGLQAFF